MHYSSDYFAIREKLIRNAESFLGLPGLKEAKVEFFKAINSNRRSSYIENFSELVRILEKRGLVGEHSIELLRKITEKFHDSELKVLMDEYEIQHQNHPRIFINEYAHPNIVPSAPSQSLFNLSEVSSSRSSSCFQPSHCTARRNEPACNLPENVIHLVCTDIGKYWMELARNLKIKEGDIDLINDKYSSSYKDKAREVLKLFVSKTDPDKLIVALLDGLIQARRRDLKEGVEELFARRH